MLSTHGVVQQIFLWVLRNVTGVTEPKKSHGEPSINRPVDPITSRVAGSLTSNRWQSSKIHQLWERPEQATLEVHQFWNNTTHEQQHLSKVMLGLHMFTEFIVLLRDVSKSSKLRQVEIVIYHWIHRDDFRKWNDPDLAAFTLLPYISRWDMMGSYELVLHILLYSLQIWPEIPVLLLTVSTDNSICGMYNIPVK